MENTKKKGQIELHYVVEIIILLVSAAIIFLFWYLLNFTNTTNQQVCHTTVVLASLLNNFAFHPNCRTQFVCISAGGDCKDITPTETVEIKNPANKDELLGAIADKMTECWDLFGSGNLDYVQGNIVGADTACAICDIVKFDDVLQNQYGCTTPVSAGTNAQTYASTCLTYKDLFDYLSETQIEGKQQTYLSYLYGKENINELMKTFADLKNDYNDIPISLSKEYAVRTGEVKNGWFKRVFGSGWWPLPVYFFDTDRFTMNGALQQKCDAYITKIS